MARGGGGGGVPEVPGVPLRSVMGVEVHQSVRHMLVEKPGTLNGTPEGKDCRRYD